jgi:hypothetical protein
VTPDTAGSAAGTIAAPGSGDTLDMPPEEAAPERGREHRRPTTAEFAEAQQEASRLLRDRVEVYGEEAEAARQLDQERCTREDSDPEATLQVQRPAKLPRLNRECRICGRKIEAPRPRRFRGPPHGTGGFLCEKCGNVFCAGHVVRVSGLLATLLSGGRFCCVLCMEEATPPRPGS